ISAGLDIYRTDLNQFNFLGEDRQTTFEQATTGFAARLGVPLTEYMSLIGSYTLNYDQVSLDEDQFFRDQNGDGVATCDPLLAGRFLCDSLGDRLSSILGVSLSYNSLNSAFRPTRGERVSISTEFAGLGGDVRYLRFRSNAQKFWGLGNSGFIFSLSVEGGAIQALQERPGAGVDDILLQDRFFLGEPRMRGFDIRGVGPRVLTQFYTQNPTTGLAELDENGSPILITAENQTRDDSIGGRKYYLGRAELEIPLGTGARELGLRPSLFVDVGALWAVTSPVLTDNPDGIQLTDDATGDPLFSTTVGADGETIPRQFTTDQFDVNGELNRREIVANSNIRETFLGSSPSPRIAVGIGVNWNSPFGPFRIDLAQIVRSVEGDDDKTFQFNVGTQF
ncbi:MAG: BamA/TamA family outer membrane protein, partial [Pseudomonadota bacterium]